ncbi:NitT/TauT family transport system ATP-binding protein [Nitrosomonas eutropha]|uniref:NitT/TauT family transport system ATP-binding protein n=1 Tax=Nitrosomonas eutropha TaxID=916 RepID=A0A1I7IED3_9PROT|nr:ABC transporter ATP-binding protein [Nitrosomonas eutropha]SFU71343.1 NitT/TauT family transport system ATP-binding protein [Nitrosomonas eutropha]
MNTIPSSSSGARLEFSNIRKSFGDTVSIEADGLIIEPGSLTILLGRSGCGKTTLLNLAAGLDFPDQGSVSYDNQVLQGPAPSTALIFQTHNLFPWMTAEENVAFPLRNQGMARVEALEHARQYLKQVELESFAGHKPSQLSGGMRQRITLARTIATKPRLLLLDEPFSALDMQTRRMMQRYLLRVWSDSAATILMITHDLHEALMLADRIVLMASSPNGHIAEILDIELDRPRNPESQAFRAIQQQLDRFLEHETLLAEHAPILESTDQTNNL